MARVVVVEDDPSVQRYISFVLSQEGHEVLSAGSGREGIEVVGRQQPDLIVLDVELPDLSGVELCRRVRASTNAPILFLTGRHDEADKVAALDAGGDEYVVKPVGPAELAARVRAMLRRQTNPAAPVRHSRGVVVDAAARRVYVNGNETAMTQREFDLLRLLVENPDRALERQQIFDQVWGVDYVGDPSVLDVYVRRLRRKIERDPDRPALIQTVHGVGYRFAGAAPEA